MTRRKGEAYGHRADSRGARGGRRGGNAHGGIPRDPAPPPTQGGQVGRQEPRGGQGALLAGGSPGERRRRRQGRGGGHVAALQAGHGAGGDAGPGSRRRDTRGRPGAPREGPVVPRGAAALGRAAVHTLVDGRRAGGGRARVRRCGTRRPCRGPRGRDRRDLRRGGEGRLGGEGHPVLAGGAGRGRGLRAAERQRRGCPPPPGRWRRAPRSPRRWPSPGPPWSGRPGSGT